MVELFNVLYQSGTTIVLGYEYK